MIVTVKLTATYVKSVYHPKFKNIAIFEIRYANKAVKRILKPIIVNNFFWVNSSQSFRHFSYRLHLRVTYSLTAVTVELLRSELMKSSVVTKPFFYDFYIPHPDDLKGLI